MTTQYNKTNSSFNPEQVSDEKERLIIPGERPPGPKIPETGRKKSSSPLMRWFNDLPIRRKQLAAFLTAETLAGLGLVGVGSALIINNGYNQLLNQSLSQLQVAQDNYEAKIRHMRLGFAGLAENPSIVKAAQEGKADPALRMLLQREIWRRGLEFVTVVDRNGRIVANGNVPRQGIVFNPDNLVKHAINGGSQEPGTKLITYEELAAESRRFADLRAKEMGVSPADSPNFLIRYMVTPVRTASADTVGAIVSADVVKPDVVRDTLKNFGKGYNAVYLRNPDGKYSLITSQLMLSPDSTTMNVPLSDQGILNQAEKANGRIVTGQQKIENQRYSLTARAIPDTFGNPIGVLVMGTSEKELNTLIAQSLGLQGLVLLTALGLGTLLMQLIGNRIVKPIENLQQTTQRFSKGERSVRAEVESSDEIGQLSANFNQLADNIVISEDLKERETRLKQLLADVSRGRESQELTVPLSQLLEEIKEYLNCDRAVVYRFLPEGGAYIAGEAVGTGLTSALAYNLKDNCISEELKTEYKQGRLILLDNVLSAGLHPEHLQLLQFLMVKSSAIVPISQNEQLFGFLIAHHCYKLHNWREDEVKYLQDFANQLSLSLAGLALIEQKQSEAEKEQQENQALQQELFKLLTDVEGAASGNLTVRADISAGQIGIVADFFNAIIENLRDLVSKVKSSAGEVYGSVQSNEEVIRQLAGETIEQANQINETLDSVEAMTASIKAVADNAQTAAMISRSASENAVRGGEAMEQTVDSILELRNTIAETAKKVKRLGESSQQISKVIALINQIALKTNLLAVNASIEAARAGEQGRGFAVVAEEVGELAAQSATATKEIEQIVETIQRETVEVVNAMELGTSQVVEGTRLVEQTKTSLEQIVQVSQQIDELLQSISHATISQTENSQKVAMLMEAVAVQSAKTSSSSVVVSENLQNAVSVAQELQASVETFTVD